MLEVVHLEKKYKDHTIFQNVNIKFQEGKLYILQGINGSGKSTLLKCIAGVIYKSSGTILKGGTISYLPDRYTMPKLMRVKDYLKEILCGVEDPKRKALDFMEQYQIPDKRIGDLSKGNQQKVGLIQVFSKESDIYLLDEPLDGLDDSTKRIVKDRIKTLLDENKIILLSLHNKTYFNDCNPIIVEVKEGTIHEKKKKS